MKLRLERTWRTDKCTIGTLSIDGAYECFTLEDVQRGTDPATVKEWKVNDETAIPHPPDDAYNIIVTHSKRFMRELPLVENVPGFEGIRIHPGNTAENTDGCILVGRTKGPTYIGESRAAFNALYGKIQAALDAGDKVTLEIV